MLGSSDWKGVSPTHVISSLSTGSENWHWYNGNSEENEIRDIHEQSNPPPLGGGLVQNLRLTLCPMSPSQVAVHGENTVHSV